MTHEMFDAGARSGRKRCHLSLPLELWRQLTAAAKTRGVPFSQFLAERLGIESSKGRPLSQVELIRDRSASVQLRQLTIRLDADTLAQLLTEAAQRKLPLAVVIRDRLRQPALSPTTPDGGREKSPSSPVPRGSVQGDHLEPALPTRPMAIFEL